MLNAINAQREKAGLAGTVPSELLSQVAKMRSQDMAGRNYFSHTTPEGTTVINLLQAQGIQSTAMGEILGRTNGPDEQSVSLVVRGFMNSPAHRDNVLSDRYTYIGVGSAVGPGNMKYYAIVFKGG